MLSKSDILDHLNRIKTSNTFRKAANELRLFEYLTRRLLEGTCDGVGELSIGEDVFDLPSDWKPKWTRAEKKQDGSRRDNPTVRVHMNKLRNRLERYVQTEGFTDPIKAEILSRNYCPTFSENNIEPHPLNQECLNLLLRCKLLLQRFLIRNDLNLVEQAYEILTTIFKINPFNETIINALADVYLIAYVGNVLPKDTIQSLGLLINHAIKEWVKTWQIVHAMGVHILITQHDPKAASTAFNEAIVMSRGQSKFSHLYPETLLTYGHFAEAKELYEINARNSNDFSAATVGLAGYHTIVGNWDEAERLLLDTLDGVNRSAEMVLFNCYLGSRNLAKALNLIQDKPRYNNLLTMIQALDGKKTAAQSEYEVRAALQEKNLPLFPERIVNYPRLAALAYILDKLPDTMHWLNKSIDTFEPQACLLLSLTPLFRPLSKNEAFQKIITEKLCQPLLNPS